MESTRLNKFKKQKNRKNKIKLVFDEEKRRDFLTGFHKRKLQRKKKAQEDLAQQLKEERKRLKIEAKESFKKLVVSHKPIPELENLLTKNYEDENVTVKIIELSTNEIANENNWIGANQPKCESENIRSDDENEIPGMELTKNNKNKDEKNKKQTFESKKDLRKVLKKQATKNFKNSKVFQKKNKIERQKQKKKSLQLKNQKEKLQRKYKKKAKGHQKV